MFHIRPFQMFSLIEESPGERIVQTAIPCRRGVGGVSLLETFLLIAGSRIVGTTRALSSEPSWAPPHSTSH